MMSQSWVIGFAFYVLFFICCLLSWYLLCYVFFFSFSFSSSVSLIFTTIFNLISSWKPYVRIYSILCSSCVQVLMLRGKRNYCEDCFFLFLLHGDNLNKFDNASMLGNWSEHCDSGFFFLMWELRIKLL
jgi:hypothetical protein